MEYKIYIHRNKFYPAEINLFYRNNTHTNKF